jgi:signal transduction histidine kinase
VLLVAVGVLAQQWELSPRSRGSADPEVRMAELEAELAAERRRADELAQELASARDEFSRTMARINDLFWTVEILPSGDITLTYLSANASGVVGKDVQAGLDALAFREGLGHPDDAEANAAFTAAMLAGEAAEVEERLVGYDGVVRWTWSRGTPRREGDRLFFDGVTTNISERHELAARREHVLDREREQLAMLEEMHRSHDDFIALAGHELRTPLTVVQGYAEHLLDDPTMGPEQRAQLEIVVRRARSMSDLIDDLFDLAKLNAPLGTVAFAPVDLDRVVEEAVLAHRRQARQRGVTLTTTTEPLQVLGDRARMRRMCDNLLDNAVKYSASGGTVTVTVRREEDTAVLEVADQGIGIPSEELPHVFERLYRATNATDGRYPGTGLGLSIALATAESHGGTATADNGPDGGAVFTVRLPLHRPEEATD